MPINWGALLGGVLSGVGGAAAASSAPTGNFTQTGSREPWGPASDSLRDALAQAMAMYQQSRDAPPPPTVSTAGIMGASPRMRDLAGAMYDRSMTSTFVPQAQEQLSQFMQGPNPMMQAAFDRAQSYRNPLFDQLSQRGFGGGFAGYRQPMQGFLGNLLEGQQSLGQPPLGPAAGIPPPPPPTPGPPMPPIPLKGAF